MNAEKLSSPIRAESSPTTQARQLLESWKDREYRVEFVKERVRASVALQIRALREQRNRMTQAQLGAAIGKAQTWISVLEDPEYGKMSVATLLSLAEAFDTDLEIKFRPFSRALHELTKQGSDSFEVRSFDQELPDLEAAATLGWIRPDGKWSDILRASQLLAPPPAPIGSPFVMTTPLSGAVQPEMQVPHGEYRSDPMFTMNLRSVSALPATRTSRVKYYRWQKRTARRKELWRKKLPKREETSNFNLSGGARTMNPSMQTAFTFTQASGI